MKTVFSSSMTAHVWAQLKQPHGRNPTRSVSFDGSVLYSYAAPIAHIVETPAGGRVVLHNCRKYSVTTAKHQSEARQAAAQYPSFTVPDIITHRWKPEATEPGHKTNIAYFRAEYTAERDALMRVPSESYRVANMSSHADDTLAHTTLCRLAVRLINYAEAFGLTDVPAIDWRKDAAAIIARRDALLADPKRAEKRAARETARLAKEARDNAARAARDAERIVEWRHNQRNHYRLSDADGRAMLRISLDGTRIESSWGAECPIDDARRALALWERRTSGIHWVLAGGQPVKLGQFTLDSIDPAGTVKAGCHTIGAGELQALCDALEALRAAGV
jgi:hypothetical protein